MNKGKQKERRKEENTQTTRNYMFTSSFFCACARSIVILNNKEK